MKYFSLIRLQTMPFFYIIFHVGYASVFGLPSTSHSSLFLMAGPGMNVIVQRLKV